MMLLEVLLDADAIDDEKILRRADRRQHGVPEIAGVVGPLAASGDERLRFARRAICVVCDDDEKRARRQRHEGLATIGMTFHHRERQGEGIGLAAEDGEDDPSVGAGRFGGCQVMVALASAPTLIG